MILTFRWFNDTDPISLEYISQIPNMKSVVTAVYDVPVGKVWPKDKLVELKKQCLKHHLTMQVIESIPVHEDIKLGKPSRDKYIANYIENIKRCAQVGVKCICYNFMPVFDWLRTNMKYKHKDGSNSLAYSRKDFEKIDPKHLHLPGWDESYSPKELQSLLKQYEKMTHKDLFNNLVYFLKKIMPTCEKYKVNMAIHPDDPPWDIFNLPRVVSNEKDLDNMFKAVPSKCNGLTFCTGSFGAGRFNDLVHMANKYAKRIYFLHARNIQYTDNKDSFVETGHMVGSLPMVKIIKVLVKNGFKGYVRPDHGRNIWGENHKPGYGLYDRALGAAYLNGVFSALEDK
ncbi:MAG: mannonate dehydratase [Bacilli bacterium]|nr:mannonate dehydratase [Bacilli bacterium]